jgi:Beta-ketoacyl synthase, N-terminal domain
VPSERLKIAAHSAFVLQQKSRVTFSSPLTRRMTPLQKALLEAVQRLQSEHSEVFTRCVVENECPVFFATAHGELATNLGLLDAVKRLEMPLSPTAFQHSVHNCPTGYLSIVFALKNAMTTLCAGRNSSQKALFLAASYLRRERRAQVRAVRSSSVLILMADEIHPGNEYSNFFLDSAKDGAPVARAEALVLECESASAQTGFFVDPVEFASFVSSLEFEEEAKTTETKSALEALPSWPWILGPSFDILKQSTEISTGEKRPPWICLL